MDIFGWIAMAAFIYTLWRYLQMKISLEAILAYMIIKKQPTPNADEMRKIQIWIIEKHLGVKTDLKDMPW